MTRLELDDHCKVDSTQTINSVQVVVGKNFVRINYDYSLPGGEQLIWRQEYRLNNPATGATTTEICRDNGKTILAFTGEHLIVPRPDDTEYVSDARLHNPGNCEICGTPITATRADSETHVAHQRCLDDWRNEMDQIFERREGHDSIY